MAATDSRPVPRRGVLYRHTFPIYDLTGLGVTVSATASYSQDNAAFAGATAAGLPNNFGKNFYFIDIPGSIMAADVVAVYVSAVVSGARPYNGVIYPEEQGDYRVNTIMWQGTTVAAVVTAGTVPVDVKYVNSTGSAGDAGKLSVNVVEWLSAAPNALSSGLVQALVADISAGAIETGSFAPGTTIPAVTSVLSAVSAHANPIARVSADVITWGGVAVAAIVTGGTIPADIKYVNSTGSAGDAGKLSVNVVEWLSAAPNALSSGLVQSLVAQISAGAIATGSFAPGATIPAVTSVNSAVSAHPFAVTVGEVTVATDGIKQASFSAGIIVSANVGQWRGTQPAALSSTLVQALVAAVSAGAIATGSFAPGTTIPAVTSVNSAVSAHAPSGLSTLTAAAVNAEVVDALSTDTYVEPTVVPAATSTIAEMVHWLYTLARNKRTTTASTEALRNDADGGNIGTAAVSDDGTTFTRAEWS